MRTFIRFAAILLVLKIASPTILIKLEELVLTMIEFMMKVLEQAQM